VGDVKIKICGITNLDDALAALDAGADVLGFNFYPQSPRYITSDACARITSAIGHRQSHSACPCPAFHRKAGGPPGALRGLESAITTVGVFVNEAPAFVAGMLNQCGLDLAQLSGDEPPETVASLARRAFKAIRPRTPEEAERDAIRYAALASEQPALLLDASHPSLYGGTGRTADWSIARQISSAYPILLAGGLTPENVARAVEAVKPWGVDVASGVESAPGRKDPRKLLDFVRAARRAIAQPA
jgi:phosphoribosylanthranilate isomerase